jgi:hypothetical protein
VNPKPGFSMSAKPQEAILAMGTQGYFNLMAKLMAGDAPPAPEDEQARSRRADGVEEHSTDSAEEN